jgi:hypothetical protein
MVIELGGKRKEEGKIKATDLAKCLDVVDAAVLLHNAIEGAGLGVHPEIAFEYQSLKRRIAAMGFVES